MLAIALVVIGTYLVFIAGSISLLKLLQKNQHFYYQPQHFIAISGMLYRMKQNAAGLATICILCTAILVSLVSSISLVVGQQRLLNFWNPFDLMLTTSKPLNQNLLKQLAAKNQIKLEKQQQIKMTAPIVGSLDQRGNFKSGYNAKTSTTLLVLTVKTFNQIEGTNYHLKNNQVLLSVADKKVYPQLKIKQKNYQVIGYPTLQTGNVQHSIFQPVYVIAANTASAKQIGSSTWIYQNGINFKSSYQHGLNFTRQIQQQLKLDNGSVSNKQEMQHFLRVIFGGLLFVGCLVSLAMAITTALIIYYKQLSEGLADQQRFKKIQQVGLSYAESKKAIQSQVLLVFMLPIVGAIVHMAFALPAIISILKMFSLFDQGLLLKVCLLVIALLTAGYLMVYGLTTRIYQRYIIN
ncbi:efflux ABC transporter, permease protein [Liquorilactobacillus vini DSM 20605]|uniref:Efflux ABC transporter, permease protein n=4 Tax=Liquorilactobacillus vini TaxID=238015 RepID=A0A0R2BVB2_9LACO|nr:efflux ABC transporter, permease protein [Liquorilactobacillus vini DSM 20605]